MARTQDLYPDRDRLSREHDPQCVVSPPREARMCGLTQICRPAVLEEGSLRVLGNAAFFGLIVSAMCVCRRLSVESSAHLQCSPPLCSSPPVRFASTGPFACLCPSRLAGSRRCSRCSCSSSSAVCSYWACASAGRGAAQPWRPPSARGARSSSRSRSRPPGLASRRLQIPRRRTGVRFSRAHSSTGGRPSSLDFSSGSGPSSLVCSGQRGPNFCYFRSSARLFSTLW